MYFFSFRVLLKNFAEKSFEIQRHEKVLTYSNCTKILDYNRFNRTIFEDFQLSGLGLTVQLVTQSRTNQTDAYICSFIFLI